MPDLPSGTLTLLFTDIEGSTRLLHQQGAHYGRLLTEYRELLRSHFQMYSGQEVDTQGDSFFVVFRRAADAVAAVVAIQRALASHPWPAGVQMATRMGLHTGAPHLQQGCYVGLDVHRAARLMAAGHGGQVLLSQATAGLVLHDLPEEVSLRDLGEHRLKDLQHPERIFQLVIAGLPANFPALKTLDSRRTNLPSQPTPLIGREREIALLTELLRRADVRLVTLTGPGGIGKTRLGLQVAAELLDDYPDGTSFINLAPLSDPALVASTIAQTLGLSEQGGRPPLEELRSFLRDKRLLLLLDNFEQVVDAAPLVAELLAGCPQLSVLVTSRVALKVRGEKEIAVPPLALPSLQGSGVRDQGSGVPAPRSPIPDPRSLTQYAAVQLFSARAQDVQSDFVVTDANAPAVAEICARLDGLPLAIELAAARVRLFAPEALLARLSGVGSHAGASLRLLTGGARDLPTRQQTLRSAIAWSYDLLDAGTQALFARLGVFVGGCTLEAVEAIGNATEDLPLDVLDGLTLLVDNSLLKSEPDARGEPRFRMLETIREYALERLAASGAAEAVRRQHAEYYVRFAERAEPELIGPHEVEWLDRVEQEHDNLRAVLQRALHPNATPGDQEWGLRLAGAVRWFWRKRGYYSEGLRWYEALLATTQDVPTIPQAVRATALRGAGRMLMDLGQYPRGKEFFEEAGALTEQVGDKAGLAEALNNLGWVPVMAGDPAAGIPLFERSLALYRELGDTRGIASTLYTLAFAAREQGDDEHAVALLVESQPLFRSVEDTGGLAWSYSLLGRIVHDQDENVRAAELFADAEQLFRKVGDKWGLTITLECLAHVMVTLGDYECSEMVAREAVELDEELGTRQLLAYAHRHLASALLHQGKLEYATAHFNESLALAREQGDEHTIGWGLHGLAKVARAQGDAARATALFEESLILFRRIGERWGIPWNLVNLGVTAQHQGDDVRAAALLKEALRLFQHNNFKSGYTLCLAGLAGVAARQNHAAGARRAARLLATIAALEEASGRVPEPFEHAYRDRIVATARVQLDEATFAAAWTEGQALSLEQAIAYALGEDTDNAEPQPPSQPAKAT